MKPDMKLYVPPFRRNTPVPADLGSRISPLPSIGLPPTVPVQRSLIALQVANNSKYGSIAYPRPSHRDTTPPNNAEDDDKTENEDMEMIDTSLQSISRPSTSLATHPPETLRERISDRPGPGPPRRPLRPFYTQLATLHLGLGHRVLEKDFDPLKDLIPRFGEGIEEVEYVGSYKWVLPDDSGRPTIAVPGKLTPPCYLEKGTLAGVLVYRYA